MTYVLWFVAPMFLCGCQQKPEPVSRHFKAVNGDQTALLTIAETENAFFGRFELQYGALGKDAGTVEGVKIGDTLKGRFSYLSYGGSNKMAPFVLLKWGTGYKLGTGQAAHYMNIPFYSPETLRFDSGFVLHPLAK